VLQEDLFTQNTGDYFMLNTVGRFIYTKYGGILYAEHCKNIFDIYLTEYGTALTNILPILFLY
jgi:hypothetical protein